jgi:EthD domain
MIKVSVFLTRRLDLTHEQFSQYWKDKHASLLMRLDSFTSHLRHYAQQHTLDNVPGGFPILPYDGSPRCGSMTLYGRSAEPTLGSARRMQSARDGRPGSRI